MIIKKVDKHKYADKPIINPHKSVKAKAHRQRKPMQRPQNVRLMKDTNFYLFMLYIFVLKCSCFIQAQYKLPKLFCFFSRRDLKPENILLDDRGMFQFFPSLFSPS